MAKDRTFLTGKVTLAGTFSQLRVPIDKKKVRSRGPRQKGQSKPSATVRLGNIGVGELKKRWDLAVQVLETGKGPKADDSKLKQCQAGLKLAGEAFLEQTKTLEDLQVKADQAEADAEEGSPTGSLEEKLKEAVAPEPQGDPTPEGPGSPDGDQGKPADEPQAKPPKKK